MKSTNESLILFGCVINLREGEVAGVVARELSNMGEEKNSIENIRAMLPTHNLRDVFLGAALYAAMLEANAPAIMAELAEAGTTAIKPASENRTNRLLAACINRLTPSEAAGILEEMPELRERGFPEEWSANQILWSYIEV